MISREKILSAFSPEGAVQLPAVVSYPSLFIRDHWFALTETPWWFRGSGDPHKELFWIRDYQRRTGLDWLSIGLPPARDDWTNTDYAEENGSVWRINRKTGVRTQLQPPRPGGGVEYSCSTDITTDYDALPKTAAEIEALFPLREAHDHDKFILEGRHELAQGIHQETGLFLCGHVSTPLSSTYGSLGFEGIMLMAAERPELLQLAVERILKGTIQSVARLAAAGLDGIWIEEIFTDSISPAMYAELVLPSVRELTAEIRRSGLKSIHYYCGDPGSRLDLLLQTGADALHLEEGKKGFSVDLREIARKLDGGMVLFGNIDAIGILEQGGDEALHNALDIQFAAAVLNRNRFVMSTGSPVTPDTSVERVKLYTELVKEH